MEGFNEDAHARFPPPRSHPLRRDLPGEEARAADRGDKLLNHRVARRCAAGAEEEAGRRLAAGHADRDAGGAQEALGAPEREDGLAVVELLPDKAVRLVREAERAPRILLVGDYDGVPESAGRRRPFGSSRAAP